MRKSLFHDIKVFLAALRAARELPDHEKEKISALMTDDYIRARTARASQEKFAQAMAKVKDREPLELESISNSARKNSMSEQEITVQSVLVRSKDINFTEMCGEIVMMSADQSEFYGLDEIAADIWRRLERQMDVQSLCDELCADYGIDFERCYADIMPFLTDMAAKKAIHVS